MSAYDAWATREPAPSPFAVTGSTHLRVWRPWPLVGVANEEAFIEVSVEVEVSDGQFESAWLEGTSVEIALNDDEQAEAVYLVALQ
jgi:hypothetical protein